MLASKFLLGSISFLRRVSALTRCATSRKVI